LSEVLDLGYQPEIPFLSAAAQDRQEGAAAAIDKVMCKYQAGYPRTW